MFMQEVTYTAGRRQQQTVVELWHIYAPVSTAVSTTVQQLYIARLFNAKRFQNVPHKL
jgi:hypothetical protein